MSNLKSRTIYCHDNLDVLRGINTNCVDLIYLDPPFNKKKVFTAPLGTSAEGAAFSDIFRQEDLKAEWLEEIKIELYEVHLLLNSVKHIEGRTSYNFCYLAYMTIRLIECRRILKETGSIYLHCDPTMSHYLKLVMDCIFGERNFRNEIIWWYGGGGASKKNWGRKHDVILFYSKGDKWTFNIDAVREEHKWTKGQRRADGSERNLSKGKIPDDVFHLHGVMPWSKERTGYPTQKPLALLERLLTASSNKGDLVLDPFCGCATTPIAAEKLERNWIGIDVSQKAFDLVRERLAKEVPVDFFRGEPDFMVTPPKRTDLGNADRPEKFVYVISNRKYEGEYKVGIASDKDRRLANYQTGDPDRGFKMEFSIKTPLYTEIEKAIHAKYENKREWIRGDLNSIIGDIKKMAKSAD